jgi:putative membrane protein
MFDMQDDLIYPHSRLMRKFFIIAGIIYGIPAAAALIIFFAVMASHGIGLGERPGMIFYMVFGGSSVLIWILMTALIPPYFRSISYELTDREVIVRKGIFTKTVKTVPYRTITNIVEERDLIDRYIVGLGSVRLQTAGMSGTAGYEASLDGLDVWEKVHRGIQDRLRAFRGSMSPTASEDDSEVSGAPVLNRILEEIKAIREALERRA